MGVRAKNQAAGAPYPAPLKTQCSPEMSDRMKEGRWTGAQQKTGLRMIPGDQGSAFWDFVAGPGNKVHGRQHVGAAPRTEHEYIAHNTQHIAHS